MQRSEGRQIGGVGIANDAMLVQSFVKLGHYPNLSVITQGVEGISWDRLQFMSCDIAQRHYLLSNRSPHLR